METGLVFCGTNAWKATRIEKVCDIFDELFSENGNKVACG
jgi:hypothetical protein